MKPLKLFSSFFHVFICIKVVPYSENWLAFMVNGGSSSSLTICLIDKKISMENLCLRAFHNTENECPPICQAPKIMSTKLLLQTLYGTTLSFFLGYLKLILCFTSERIWDAFYIKVPRGKAHHIEIST